MDDRRDVRRRAVCGVAYTDYLSDPRVRRESEALARRGFDVTVLCLRREGEPPDSTIEGVRVLRLDVARQRGGGVGAYVRSYASFFVRAALHLTRRPRRYDLVHVHSIPEALVFAALVPRLLGTPVLLDVHDLSTELYANRRGRAPWPVRLAERASLRFASRIVTVHDRYAELLVERGVPRHRIDVVLNVPDERLFGAPRTPAWGEGGLRLAYHGTFVERYGLDNAVDAAAALRDLDLDVRLDLHGDGDHREAVVQRIAALELGGTVHVSAGAVGVHEIAGLVGDAHIGLVPFLDSPFTADILPTKLLEYVSLGIPVVVTRNRVIEHYFGEADVSYVPPGDTQAIVDAVIALWRDPDAALAQASRAQVAIADHSWAHEQDRLVAAVDQLVAA